MATDVVRRELHNGRVGSFGLEEVTLPNGVHATLEILRHPGAAAIVPLHDDGTVTLLRQHRHAVGATIWEIPAGKLEPGEDPAACAARELVEEAGLRAGSVTHLTTIYTTPAFTDEVIHLYVGRQLTAVPAAPDADEVLQPVRMPLAEAIALVRGGAIPDAKTICALLWVASG